MVVKVEQSGAVPGNSHVGIPNSRSYVDVSYKGTDKV
jgi:hypothetical protein